MIFSRRVVMTTGTAIIQTKRNILTPKHQKKVVVLSEFMNGQVIGSSFNESMEYTECDELQVLY